MMPAAKTNPLVSMLTRQINHEFTSWQIHLQLALRFDNSGFTGFGAWLKDCAATELAQAMKMIEYAQSSNREIKLLPISAPAIEAETPNVALEKLIGYQNEQLTSVNTIIGLAMESQDFSLVFFMRDYLASLQDQIRELKRILLRAESAPGATLSVDTELAARHPAN